MIEFPTLTDKPDSSTYTVDREDPGIGNDMEGGYKVTRPRFTRSPRRTFKFGYTFLSNDDYLLLEAFWNETRGTSNSFVWHNQFTDETITVRFTKYWSAKYAGAGSYRAWDVTGIELEEV